ncbi:PKD domain-containing protein [Candidatus Woesearchaeota archaeon]|nr:PKD domain-containing protein [Candidatus Woesearchaeota archaeon]
MKKTIIAILLAFILLVQVIPAIAEGTDYAPIVTIIQSASSGEAPMPVYFMASVIDENPETIQYEWDLGDGATSTSEDAFNIYTVPGTYTVTLLVRDNGGNIGTAQTTVTVTEAAAHNYAPIVNILPSQEKGNAPLAVAFTSAIVDENPSTLEYSWDFGDGGTSTSEDAVNIYTIPGTYTVTLMVRDDVGNIGMDTTNIVVEDNANTIPVAVAVATPVYGPAPLTVVFNGEASTDTDGDFLTFMWDFGDGSISSDRSPVHTYTTPGSYIATLTVNDGHNGVSVDTELIVVGNAMNIPPVAVAHANPMSGNVPLTVTFIGQGFDADGEIERYFWDFGDGTTSESQNPVHTYAIEGNFRAELVVYDQDGGIGKDELIISVGSPAGVNPIITSIPDQTIEMNALYEYQVVAYDPLGDELTYAAIGLPSGLTINPSTGLISGVPIQLGNFDVIVVVSDDNGGEAREEFTLTVVKAVDMPKKYRPNMLSIDRIFLTNGEILTVNDLVEAGVLVGNEADFDMENIKVTVSIPELGLYGSSLIEDLDNNRDHMARIAILDPIPEGVKGDFIVRITVSNDHIRRIIHREITII